MLLFSFPSSFYTYDIKLSGSTVYARAWQVTSIRKMLRLRLEVLWFDIPWINLLNSTIVSHYSKFCRSPFTTTITLVRGLVICIPRCHFRLTHWLTHSPTHWLTFFVLKYIVTTKFIYINISIFISIINSKQHHYQYYHNTL